MEGAKRALNKFEGHSVKANCLKIKRVLTCFKTEEHKHDLFRGKFL